jgi:hypothetical protein
MTAKGLRHLTIDKRTSWVPVLWHCARPHPLCFNETPARFGLAPSASSIPEKLWRGRLSHHASVSLRRQFRAETMFLSQRQYPLSFQCFLRKMPAAALKAALPWSCRDGVASIFAATTI